MIHKCAELGCVWPVQLLGSLSMRAVSVKADSAPPIPRGKQGQQQKLYRIKVLEKPRQSWFYRHFVFPVHSSFYELYSQKPDEAGRSLSVILEMRTYILPLTLNHHILCKTELLAKPLSPPNPPIAFHPHENLRSELYSVVFVPGWSLLPYFLFHPMSGVAWGWTEVYLFINKLVCENQYSELKIDHSFLIFTKPANFLMES